MVNTVDVLLISKSSCGLDWRLFKLLACFRTIHRDTFVGAAPTNHSKKISGLQKNNIRTMYFNNSLEAPNCLFKLKISRKFHHLVTTDLIFNMYYWKLSAIIIIQLVFQTLLIEIYITLDLCLENFRSKRSTTIFYYYVHEMINTCSRVAWRNTAKMTCWCTGLSTLTHITFFYL